MSKKKQPSGFIDLKKHKRIVCIGDMHGDFAPFIGVLLRAGLIIVPEDVEHASSICHRGNEDRSGYPITKAQADSIMWSGKDTVAVFSGDILDNRRDATDDQLGVCAKTGTQEMLIYLIGTLNKKARKRGGALCGCWETTMLQTTFRTITTTCAAGMPRNSPTTKTGTTTKPATRPGRSAILTWRE